MAVHMIRVIAAVDSTDTPDMTPSEINTALDDWVSKNSEWVNDTDDHTIIKTTPAFGNSNLEYFVGTYRFELVESKENLFTKCEDKIKNKVDWYRLGYHLCDHDETNPQGCSWDDVREWTSANTASIPSDVPTLL